jgi:tetratricopeptide (TPR) repeat protein
MSGGSMGEWKARILHISDLHERGPREGEPFRRRRVLGEAWKRNLDELLEDGAIDLVCFTGDIADWGKPEEYGLATGFIEALLQWLSLPIDRLFLVPGNHDIDRTKGARAWTALRGDTGTAGKLSRVSPLDLSRWMAGGGPPLGLEDISREELLSRQGAYREWVSHKLGRPQLVPAEKAPHRFLGYRQTLRLPNQPFEIQVVGLDSAWLAGNEHDRGELLLTTNQAGQLTTDSQGEPLPGFRLALVHHPLSDLADKDACQQLLADNVDLLLRGHLHDEAVETWAAPGRTSRQLVAGCLYEGHHADVWPNACHVITATLDARGRPLRYELRFRSWSPRGHWHNDNSLYPGTQDGRLTWWIDQRPIPPPIPPTDLFVGRQAELDQLKAALLPAERRPVALCAVNGMPGVGKSYLAAHFAQLHQKDFPGGCPRLVLNPLALPTVELLLGELGIRLELPSGAHMAERCRERLLRPLSLLVVENVDSQEATDVTVQLATALQGCPFLVTGRYQGFSRAGGWTRVAVQTFDETTALELLKQELIDEAGRLERAQALKLMHALGHLPLALHLAAGHLRASHSVESFLSLLKKKGLDLAPAHRDDPLFTQDRARAIIRTTFELSLEVLRRQFGTGDEAGRWLAGFAALGHAPLSSFGQGLGAAIAGLSEQEFRELAAAATSLSLLGRVPIRERKDDAWRVHPLLAELLRTLPGAAPGLERMTQWFVERLPQLPSGEEQKQGERWEEVYRESQALVDWLLQVPEEDCVRVAQAGSWLAIHVGPFPAWMNLCERALRHSLSIPGRSSILWTLANVAKSAGELTRALSAAKEKRALDQARQAPREAAIAAQIQADILQIWGESDEALRILRQEMLPTFAGLGDMHSHAGTLVRIADILMARGEPDEALRILSEEVIPMLESLNDMHARATALGRVADILQSQGAPDGALRTLRQDMLPVFEHLGDVYGRAGTLSKIAGILQAKGELDEAFLILNQDVLPVFNRLGDVRESAVTLLKIVDILESRGKWDEALRILKQEVLPAFERLGDIRERAATLAKVADILQFRGELGEALRIRREEEFPAFDRLGDMRSRAATLTKVADILQTQGEKDEAFRILSQEVLPAFERLGDDYSRAVTRAKMADILLARGNLDEALRTFEQDVLPVFERLGNVHARTVALGRVADIFHLQGKLDEALRIHREEELPVFERLKDVRERAVVLGKMAGIFHARGESDEALRILRQEVIPTFEHLREVRSWAVALGKMADVLQTQGKMDDALHILRHEALPVFDRLDDVRERAWALGKIANILHHQGKSDEALRILMEEVLPSFERIGAAQECQSALQQIDKIRSGK